MDREDLMEFFRDDDLLNKLSRDDLNEIALNCLSHSDYLYNITVQHINYIEREG